MTDTIVSSNNPAGTRPVESIPDTQNLPDQRQVALHQVGIQGFRMPITIGGWQADSSKTQQVAAQVEATVDLRADVKGIHMSRITNTLGEIQRPLDLVEFSSLLRDVQTKQQASNAHLKIDFTYFLVKSAPISGHRGPQGYDSTFQGQIHESSVQLEQTVRVPVKTLCPCSKAISDYGAHNQRGYVTVTLRHNALSQGTAPQICLEEIVSTVEKCASAPIYPVLKRIDERHITMQAYDNPAFVEDVARNVAVALRKDDRFDSYTVKVLNHESIHDHAAYAVVHG